jgi:hypothetical protein
MQQKRGARLGVAGHGKGGQHMAYTCKNCGAVAEAPGHLCNPCGDASKCSFCGAPQVDPRHVCKDKLAAMNYVCDGCGRVAMAAGHLCKPSPIK